MDAETSIIAIVVCKYRGPCISSSSVFGLSVRGLRMKFAYRYLLPDPFEFCVLILWLINTFLAFVLLIVLLLMR